MHNKYHHQQRQSLKRQQGVVIVVALFIVALVATMAYVMMARLERDTHRVSLILHDTQAALYAQASLAWAMDELRNNWEMRRPHQLVDHTPIQSPVNEVNGYQVRSVIYDQQALFNLNNLNNLEAQHYFRQLMKLIVPNMTDEKIQAILRAILDWVSPVEQESEFNKYYLNLPTPYRQAHKPLLHITELRLIKGIDPSLFNAMKAYVTVLPKETAINIYAAPMPVLMSLDPAITKEIAKNIMDKREQVSFKKFNEEVIKKYHLEKKITTVSDYFLVETHVSIENQHISLYTLLERNREQSGAKVTIIWQSKSV